MQEFLGFFFLSESQLQNKNYRQDLVRVLIIKESI